MNVNSNQVYHAGCIPSQVYHAGCMPNLRLHLNYIMLAACQNLSPIIWLVVGRTKAGDQDALQYSNLNQPEVDASLKYNCAGRGCVLTEPTAMTEPIASCKKTVIGIDAADSYDGAYCKLFKTAIGTRSRCFFEI